MKVLQINIAVKNIQEGENIADDYYKSHIAQSGIYQLGHNYRNIDLSEWDQIKESPCIENIENYTECPICGESDPDIFYIDDSDDRKEFTIVKYTCGCGWTDEIREWK